jgi:hypothetical protein
VFQPNENEETKRNLCGVWRKCFKVEAILDRKKNQPLQRLEKKKLRHSIFWSESIKETLELECLTLLPLCLEDKVRIRVTIIHTYLSQLSVALTFDLTSLLHSYKNKKKRTKEMYQTSIAFNYRVNLLERSI